VEHVEIAINVLNVARQVHGGSVPFDQHGDAARMGKLTTSLTGTNGASAFDIGDRDKLCAASALFEFVVRLRRQRVDPLMTAP